MCCVGGCDKMLSERLGVRLCVMLVEPLGEGLSRLVGLLLLTSDRLSTR